MELLHAQKNKWEDDWLQYLFYAKIGFLNLEGVGEVVYPSASDILSFEHTYQPDFNKHLLEFKAYVHAFKVVG